MDEFPIEQLKSFVKCIGERKSLRVVSILCNAIHTTKCLCVCVFLFLS